MGLTTRSLSDPSLQRSPTVRLRSISMLRRKQEKDLEASLNRSPLQERLKVLRSPVLVAKNSQDTKKRLSDTPSGGRILSSLTNLVQGRQQRRFVSPMKSEPRKS